MNETNRKLAVELRHALHAYPELSNQEHWTKERLMGFLREHTQALDIVDKGRWFYAAYRAGKERPGIAFRADFDAVPVEDACGKAYASTVPGVGHQCGHDGHSACLAAFALEIDRSGADKNVFFLFQHAEETGDGAKECAALFDCEQVDEIFGFHNSPGSPLGTVLVRDGCIYCASEGMTLSFQGTPSHASMPENGKNPAYAISNLIQALPRLTEPGKHKGILLATIIQVNIGERAFGTQASRGQLLLTIRAQYETELNQLRDAIGALARQEAQRDGLTLEITYCDVFPETVNYKTSHDKIRAVCKKMGVPVIEMEEPCRPSEDFGYYTKRIPGAFFCIGTGEEAPPLHTTGMDFNDEIIPLAAALYRGLLEEDFYDNRPK